MTITRRGFIGGLLAAAGAAIARVPVVVDEPTFAFTCIAPDGSVTKRVEVTRAQVAERGMSAPLNEVHGQLLSDLIVYGCCVLHVTHGGRRVYGRNFSCNWVGGENTRYGSPAGRDAGAEWRRLVCETHTAAHELEPHDGEPPFMHVDKPEAEGTLDSTAYDVAMRRIEADPELKRRYLLGEWPLV